MTTFYDYINLGCKMRVSSGLDWVFEQVEDAIILEDDCLPSQSFFWFCEELLERYRDDERVMVISGDNFEFGRKRTQYSYYFSRYIHTWGWASWRRAWSYYEKDMQSWPYIRDNDYMQDILLDKTAVKYWSKIFEAVYKNKIDTWDYQWTFSCWIQNGLTVLPNVNLVSNIGFGEGGTHTKVASKIAMILALEITLPLKHPPTMIRDDVADRWTELNVIRTSVPIAERILRKIWTLVQRITPLCRPSR